VNIGAASIVSYVLGITNVDPLRYRLAFERFLHPERRDCPDLDIEAAAIMKFTPAAATVPPAMPDVHHGHAACPAAPSRSSAGCRPLPQANCACRRSASPADLGHRHARTAHHRSARGNRGYVINGQKILTSRESIPISCCRARTTPREEAKTRTGGLSVSSSTCGSAGHQHQDQSVRTMMNHATTEVFFDDLRVPAEIDRRGSAGVPLHSHRHERRADPDAAECIGDAKWFIAKASAMPRSGEFGRPIG
jgi:hypothetical protein